MMSQNLSWEDSSGLEELSSYSFPRLPFGYADDVTLIATIKSPQGRHEVRER